MSIIFETKNWKWEISENGINKSFSVKGNEENLVLENQYFAYRSSLSYDAKKHPQMDKERYENELILAPYCRLKEQKYLSQATKEMLKTLEKCYKLCKKSGEYSFIEWERNFGFPYSLKEGENSFGAVNKFEDQKPFIRLLCTHTAEETGQSFTVAKFDKEIPANKQMTLLI